MSTLSGRQGRGSAGFRGGRGPTTMSLGLGRRAGAKKVVRSQATGLVVALLGGMTVLTTAAPPASAGQIFAISTFAGTGDRGFSGDGGPATGATFSFPRKVAVDAAGRVYIADRFNFRIRQVDLNGVITTVAGGGDPADGIGDDGPATGAHIRPVGVAVDASGNIFIADDDHDTIRKVSGGIITTVAGNNFSGYSGDGGPASSAQLNGVYGVAIDAAGNLYIGDGGNSVIRKVDAGGTITTMTPAANVSFGTDIASSPDGKVYVASAHDTVRRYDQAGNEFDFAGTGSGSYSGDGGPAVNATLSLPSAVAVDSSGNVYIADTRNNVIRKVDTLGIITTVAGNGVAGFDGDGGEPTKAQLFFPNGVAPDAHGGFYIGDQSNQRVRHVVRVPDLLGVKIAGSPRSVNVDETLTYTVTVDNNDLVGATGVTTTQGLAGSAFVSATPSQGTCGLAATTLTCRLGTIPANGQATIAVVVKPSASGTLSSTVNIRANETDTYPSDDSATIQTQVGAKGCGRTISADTKLGADLGPCPANGLVVGKDGITLNLAGFRVFGFPGPGNGNAAGIVLNGRSNVTVMNGTVSDFDAGVLLVNGGNNTVKKMTVRDNIGPDDLNTGLGDGIIMFDSGNNVIDGNRIDHNGIFDNIGEYGVGCAGNVISNNLITNAVGPTAGGSSGQGIISNAHNTGPNTGVVLHNITIMNNTVRDSASGGIANFDVVDSLVKNNVVTGSGTTNSRGNGIAMQLPFTAVTQIANNRVLGNQVHDNQVDGIQVQGDYNIVQNNNAANNSKRGQDFGVDLHDANLDRFGQPTCLHDVWKNNVWGNAFYSPDCAKGTGSFGPSPAAKAQMAASTTARASADGGPDTIDQPVVRRVPTS